MVKSKHDRDSNIELLRVVAMFLVLVVHSDFFSLGAPSSMDIKNHYDDSVFRIFFQSLSIACVNIFVFISGWFGIKPKVKGICGFIFQCLFFLIGIYVVSIIIGISSFSLYGIRGCIAATPLNWFIKAYLLLYILSPVLNLFIENATRSQYKTVLIGFYAFQFFYGWVFSSSTSYIQDGYSPLSFIGLYLLARYVNIFRPSFTKLKKSVDLFVILTIVVFVTVIYLVSPEIGNRFLNYISPTTIAVSVFSVLLFSKFQIQSRFINWWGRSSFAVFLLHTNPNVIWHFKDMCIRLHSVLSPIMYWVVICIILLLIFAFAVLFDQVRIFLWNHMLRLVNNKLETRKIDL